jgi:hypothetical protein
MFSPYIYSALLSMRSASMSLARLGIGDWVLERANPSCQQRRLSTVILGWLHTFWVYCSTLRKELPDGHRALSASDDQTLKLWGLVTGNPLAAFTADAALPRRGMRRTTLCP